MKKKQHAYHVVSTDDGEFVVIDGPDIVLSVHGSFRAARKAIKHYQEKDEAPKKEIITIDIVPIAEFLARKMGASKAATMRAVRSTKFRECLFGDLLTCFYDASDEASADAMREVYGKYFK